MDLVWWSGSGPGWSGSIGAASVVRQVSGPMRGADRATIRDPDVARALLAMLAATFAQGPDGAQVDSVLVASAWGFDHADVRVPERMWHDDTDEDVPIGMTRQLAGRVAAAEFTAA